MSHMGPKDKRAVLIHFILRDLAAAIASLLELFEDCEERTDDEARDYFSHFSALLLTFRAKVNKIFPESSVCDFSSTRPLIIYNLDRCETRLRKSIEGIRGCDAVKAIFEESCTRSISARDPFFVRRSIDKRRDAIFDAYVTVVRDAIDEFDGDARVAISIASRMLGIFGSYHDLDKDI